VKQFFKSIRFWGAIGIAFLAVNVKAQDHGHLNVGAESQTAGSKLIFANGANFATNSGYVKTLTFTNGAVYAGYFQGNTTLTALPATAAHAGPDPQAPAPGSYIQAQIVSVEGPDDGEFSFWDTGATVPTISVKVGATSSTLFRLSESDGSPDSDPYGHIHGRRMTLTKAGIYKVGFRAVDTSTNGPNGGPVHAPSDVLITFFEAGVNIAFIEPDVDHTHINFVAPLGDTWQVEASNLLGPDSVWNPVGDPIVGNDVFREAVDEHEVVGQRYYRVRNVPQSP
jgi:hypothetical protein